MLAADTIPPVPDELAATTPEPVVPPPDVATLETDDVDLPLEPELATDLGLELEVVAVCVAGWLPLADDIATGPLEVPTVAEDDDDPTPTETAPLEDEREELVPVGAARKQAGTLKTKTATRSLASRTATPHWRELSASPLES
jgi:hypothetical protein